MKQNKASMEQGQNDAKQYRAHELDVILRRLNDELRTAVNREEARQIRATIQYFKQERSSAS